MAKSKKKVTKKKVRGKKIQFCVSTLKYYQANGNERDYSIHTEHFQRKLDKDLAIGDKRREDPEIRLIKCYVGKYTEKGTVKYKEPKYIQSVLKEFPSLINRIHNLQLEANEQGNIRQISKAVLDEFFSHTTNILVEENDEKYNKLLTKLVNIHQSLIWRVIERTNEPSSPRTRITNFLSRELDDLI